MGQSENEFEKQTYQLKREIEEYKGGASAGYFFLGMGVFSALIFFCLLPFDGTNAAAVLFGGGIISLIGFATAYGDWKCYRNAKAQLSFLYEERAAKRQAEAEQKRQQEALWASGKWTFPARKFYAICTSNGITKLDSSFAVNKIVLLASTCMEEAGLPKQYHHLYIDEEKAKAYYLREYEKDMTIKAEKQKEFERRCNEPQTATLTPEESAIIRQDKELISRYGRDKRHTILKREASVLTQSITALAREIASKEAGIKSSQDSLFAIGEGLGNASKQKTQSWGLAGGIAEGLAGPAAGIAAASDVMAKNARIEAENAAVQQHYRQKYSSIAYNVTVRGYSEVSNLESQKKQLEKKLTEVEDKIRLCEQKVVLNEIPSKDLVKCVHPKVVNITRQKNNALEVTITVKNTFVPEVPDGVKIVLDGVISAEVYRNKIHVGTAVLPFPIDGIPCGTTVTLKALCPKYLEGDQKYTLKYTYHNLWAMEQ